MDEVDLQVDAKEFFVVVGPPGCGKSTLLRLIAGLEVPTSGHVSVGGRRMDGRTASSRGIGVVFPGNALFEHMTVAENVGFGLEARGVGRAEIRRRVGELLSLFRLDALSDREPQLLGAGQKYRVALARALAPRPPVLLLDDPFRGLDPDAGRQARRHALRWQRDLGIATLLFTRDQGEALELGDRVAVMNRGRFAQIDTPQGIYERPATEFVERFIGRASLSATTPSMAGPVAEQPQLAIGVDRSSAAPVGPRDPFEKEPFPDTALAFLGRIVKLEVRLTGGRLGRIAGPEQVAGTGPLDYNGDNARPEHSDSLPLPVYVDSSNGSSPSNAGP